jgi:hypothetical protein
MIEIYCKKKCKGTEVPCEECQELIEYSNLRIAKCPYMETKRFCSSCNAHCYNLEHREKIKKIMRFSGPRMIFYHPITTLKHMISVNQKK